MAGDRRPREPTPAYAAIRAPADERKHAERVERKYHRDSQLREEPGNAMSIRYSITLAVLGAVTGTLVAFHRRWGAEPLPCAWFEDLEPGIVIIPMCLAEPAAWWAVALAALSGAVLGVLAVWVIRDLVARRRAVSTTPN